MEKDLSSVSPTQEMLGAVFVSATDVMVPQTSVQFYDVKHSKAQTRGQT